MYSRGEGIIAIEAKWGNMCGSPRMPLKVSGGTWVVLRGYGIGQFKGMEHVHAADGSLLSSEEVVKATGLLMS